MKVGVAISSTISTMDNEIKSIHEFDFNLICEYFSGLERQGPGSPEMTIKALSFIDNLTNNSRIADIGCGTGGQTMVLAQNTLGHIVGIDLFSKFIEIFNNNVTKLNLSQRVLGVVGSMEALENVPGCHFHENSLDLIWSEGSIYNIGFERGLREWRKFLVTGGYIAITEASWFTEERPAEIESFWNDAYPQIDTIANKIAQMQKAGYIPVASFVLPESCWLENFYQPQTQRREVFLKCYAGNKAAEQFVAMEQHEEDLYHKYKQHYGYVFYIGKKI